MAADGTNVDRLRMDVEPDVTDTTAPATPSMSLPARLFGVLLSPRATYAAIAERPRWLGALAVLLVLAMAPTTMFMATDVGKQAWLDAALRQQEALGRTISDAQYQGMERMQSIAPYITAVGQFIFIPIMLLIIAAVCFAIFNALLGGDAAFKQVLAIVAHSNVIIGLSTVFTVPIMYARQAMTGATNLAVFLPFLEDTSFAARFLGAIDLFWSWWIVSLSIGLGVLYKRRTGPIAIALMSVYIVIALVIALIRTALAGA